MTSQQITLDEVDDPCLQCKKLGLDEQVPVGCPLLRCEIPERCFCITNGMEAATTAINKFGRDDDL